MTGLRNFTRVSPIQALFALTALSLAAYVLVYGDYAPDGQGFPGWVPGGMMRGYLAGLLLLGAGIALCMPRGGARAGAVILVVYLAFWALQSVPSVLSMPQSLGAWYPISEALSSLMGACLLLVLLTGPSADFPVATRFAQGLFGLTCVFYGVSHFIYATYTSSMVPVWLPVPRALAYLTGAAHIAAGVGIASGVLPRLAATLEAFMMALFGLLVWVPSFFAHPRPSWATPPQNQWSELVVNLVLVAAACAVAASFAPRRAGARPAPAPTVPPRRVARY